MSPSLRTDDVIESAKQHLTTINRSLTVGTNGTFTVNFTPTGATNKNFTVQSDDVAVATVSAVGPVVTVVPVAAGTANAIVITDDGQKVAVVDITVAAA